MKENRKPRRRRLLLLLPGILLLLWLMLFVSSRIRAKRDLTFLRDEGYEQLVSAGDYSVNVIRCGNENGAHRIIAMAGFGIPDCCITMRRMTAHLEQENQVIFVDRAGYGMSDDTDTEMTVEQIVGAYRTALQNAGIPAPYVLMPHSIGGLYATYWESRYPDEVEAVAIIDGTELEAIPPEHQPTKPEGEVRLFYALDRAGLGGAGNLPLKAFLPPKDWLSDDEQRAEYAMTLMTYDSKALLSESALECRNVNTAWEAAVTNEIPKIYITTAYLTEDALRADGASEETVTEIMRETQAYLHNVLNPYLERLGNCELISLPGDHLIYETEPDACGEIIRAFIAGLN